MNKHVKKMITPIVIIAAIIIFIAMQFISVISEPVIMDIIPQSLKIPALLVLLSAIVTCFFILRERIKEIKSGEEDDLDKY